MVDPGRKLQKQRNKARPKKLDLLFIQDTTGSQEAYINASIARCKDICLALTQSGRLENEGLRVGLLAFRDHYDEYITQDFGGFTQDVDAVLSNLTGLVADGGDDGPEAVTAALHKASALNWRGDAAKVAILITDAPPHGIGEDDDNFWDGDPDGKDPLHIARLMKKRGIALLVIACEPTLSNAYDFTHDFYMALAKITCGSMLPLTNTEILAPIIIGFVLEHVVIDSLVSKFTSMVKNLSRQRMTQKEIVERLFALLRRTDTEIPTVQSTQVYSEPAEAAQSVSTWLNAKNISAARDELLQSITPTPRIPQGSIPPSTPWPKYLIKVTLKNLRDFYIQYRYSEDGEAKDGLLKPVQIQESPTEFLLNNWYSFTLKKGRTTKSTTRSFTEDCDWDLSVFFD